MPLYECLDSLIKALEGPRHVWDVRKVIKHFGDMLLHIYMKTVLSCLLLFYAAVIQFAIGVVYRTVTESETSLCVMYCNMY